MKSHLATADDGRFRETLCSTSIVFVLLAFTWHLLLPSTVRADDRGASSIAEFVEAKDRWDRLVGRPMRLEGRFTVFSPSELRFRNCNMRFLLSKSFARPKKENVEVTGQIIRKKGKLVFRVTGVIPHDNDGETLKYQRAILDSSKPEEAYKLADWARLRGEFYDDAELKATADQLFEEGLRVARQHLQASDVDGIRALAAKAKEVGIDDRVRQRFLHEAVYLEWTKERTAQPPQFGLLRKVIVRDLPGALTPLSASQLSLRQDYASAPLAVYRVADTPTRKLLDRAVYLEATLADIEQGAAKDGRNGDQIANRIEREAPELTSLAASYRQRELNYLMSRIGQLSRGQMIDLADRYPSKGQASERKKIIRQWLKTQESRAQREGPTSLMELGDEYVNLLRDERAAGRLYKLAYGMNSQLATATEWLTAHGYELRSGRWTKPGESDEEDGAMVDAGIEEAIREGRIHVGMTAAQVQQALGTKPSSVVRMASSGQIAELWVFKDYGITVQLKRRSSKTTAEVVAIGTVN